MLLVELPVLVRDEAQARIGNDWIDIVPRAATDAPHIAQLLTEWATSDIRYLDGHIHIPVADKTASLLAAAAALHHADIAIDDFSIRTPSLDEVFAELTDTTATSHIETPPHHAGAAV